MIISAEVEAISDRLYRYYVMSDAGWCATGDAVRGDGDTRICSCNIKPLGGGDLTAALFRTVSLGEIKMRVSAQLSPSHLDETPPEPSTDRRGRYQAMSSDILREVAERYLRETTESAAPRPISRMAEHYGRPEETVRTWVHRARKAGWLSPGVRGRMGALPGPRLMAYREQNRAGSRTE